MPSQHVPAWQRIVIKQQQGKQEGNDFIDEDPLNVTTHLATGTLTKKEKKRIIRGDNANITSRVAKKKINSNKKREKLNREDRDDKRRKTVLKDQLRYLIDFYLYKVSDDLPEALCSLPNVQSNYPEEALNERKKNDTVIEIWKFSKQKQNWLIKHFFRTEEIPVEYDELLISYFADLKSEFLRSSLSERCWGNIKEWNDFAEQQELEIKNIVEGNTEEKADAQENSQEDEKDVEKTKEKNEETTIPPNKQAVARSVKLLEVWNLDKHSENSIELKNF